MQPARPSMAIRSSLNETSFDNCLFWTKNSWGEEGCFAAELENSEAAADAHVPKMD